MRIWDIDPGFLNNQSLLGEHRELHGIVSIFVNDKKGYRYHPETKRWMQSLGALYIRHELLVQEMRIRNFNHKSPLTISHKNNAWPVQFIDKPANQYRILKEKYKDREMGRVNLPKNSQSLWANHKYSVMARGYHHYKTIGAAVTDNRISFEDLAGKLVFLLREPPAEKGLRNTLDHLWGYMSKYSDLHPDFLTSSQKIEEIRRQSLMHNITYLMNSTAIGELGYWCRTACVENQSA